MTPPSRITVSAGIDQTTNSIRSSYDSSVPRLAWVLDERYHQANANVATITGITTTSMIAVELIRRSRCADAIGPCGSTTPPEQPARKGSAIRALAIPGDSVRRFEGRKTVDQYIDDGPANVAVLT